VVLLLLCEYTFTVIRILYRFIFNIGLSVACVDREEDGIVNLRKKHNLKKRKPVGCNFPFMVML